MRKITELPQPKKTKKKKTKLVLKCKKKVSQNFKCDLRIILVVFAQHISNWRDNWWHLGFTVKVARDNFSTTVATVTVGIGEVRIALGLVLHAVCLANK
jgi:hypothetical protein